MSRFRRLKKDVRAILADPDWQNRLTELEAWAPKELVPPLLSLRLDKDEEVRWRTVTAFGLTAGRMAEASMEQTRVLMRTCMWYMNEESGNLGWGIPHFMAEAMVHNEKVAKEFHKILASYIFCDEKCDGNFLDHPELRRDVFWALARLASERPEYVRHSERFLVAALEEEDPYNRAYAAWTLGILKADGVLDKLEGLASDGTEIRTFRDNQLVDVTVGELVSHAVALMG
ncbi:DVU0298 family protein [Pseudodesulfovibrio sp. zrk46]|uniref:DVU0298 family protein n=1 Tax=Pseudodesulfovibrio sp. zrk46 TaxID=2725288 RepID=UPI001448AF79|nr:DVU0298 family protein [Pseudodesulfovibrio sp. zrk46]QJB58298.1 HEAT repeat domain-containing protein [Pseudodesulfovibrio sp. zrk46]